MSCDSLYAVIIPQGLVGWSSVCDCGISWPYLLNLKNELLSIASVLDWVV